MPGVPARDRRGGGFDSGNMWKHDMFDAINAPPPPEGEEPTPVEDHQTRKEPKTEGRGVSETRSQVMPW